MNCLDNLESNKPTLENPVSFTEVKSDRPMSDFRNFSEIEEKPKLIYKTTNKYLWRFMLTNYDINVDTFVIIRDGEQIIYKSVFWRIWWRL